MTNNVLKYLIIKKGNKSEKRNHEILLDSYECPTKYRMHCQLSISEKWGITRFNDTHTHSMIILHLKNAFMFT